MLRKLHTVSMLAVACEVTAEKVGAVEGRDALRNGRYHGAQLFFVTYRQLTLSREV